MTYVSQTVNMQWPSKTVVACLPPLVSPVYIVGKVEVVLSICVGNQRPRGNMAILKYLHIVAVKIWIVWAHPFQETIHIIRLFLTAT